MTPERFNRLNSVLDKRQPDLTVVTDEVHKGRNIAAILRTCDAVGIDTIHTIRPEDGYRPYRGTALGSQKWVEVKLYDQLADTLIGLKEQGFQLVVTALSGKARDFREVDYTLPTALILGAENDGVSDVAQAMADCHVTIPMVGMVESYNVSVACAVVLSEAQRQRSDAGLYIQSRLAPELRKQRFFKWAHPVVAKYCDERNLPYPEVNEEGEIIEPARWYHQVRGGAEKV